MKAAKRSGVSTQVDAREFGTEAGFVPVGMMAAEGFVFPEAHFLPEFDAHARATGGAHRAPRLDLKRVGAVIRRCGD